MRTWSEPFPPLKLGQWRTLTEAGRRQWLSMARSWSSLYNNQVIADRPQLDNAITQVITIDGSFITDFSSFLCELGEALNGPGGFFGDHFHMFDDCLFGGYGLVPPCKIIWRNAALSKQNLDNAALRTWCKAEIARIDSLEEIWRVPGDRDWFIELAQSEETLFDRILDTIASVTDRYSKPDYVIEVVLD